RKFLVTALLPERRKLEQSASKLPTLALQAPAFAPHPQQTERSVVYSVSSAVHDVRPIVRARRTAECKPALAKYPELTQANLPERVGRPPQGARYSTPPLVPGAVTRRGKPTLAASAFQALASGRATAGLETGSATAPSGQLPDRKLLTLQTPILAPYRKSE